MLSSAFDYRQSSIKSCSGVLTSRLKNNLAVHHKHQPNKLAMTCRINREKNDQIQTTHLIPLSLRGKQNDSNMSKDFSVLIHPAFTKKLQQTKTPSFNKQLPKNNLNSQRKCLTQCSTSSQSHCDNSRSKSKRKKKGQYLFNFTAKNETISRQSAKKFKQNTFKDTYIKSFLLTNKSQFISVNNYQFTNSQSIQTSSNPDQSNRYDKEKIENKGCILKQTNYDKIRQKMKKLKNMTQMREFKRKPLKHKTTEQEWNQIQRVVRTVCREEMKRVDTEETIETRTQESTNNIDANCREKAFGCDKIEDENESQQQEKKRVDDSHQDIAKETKRQMNEMQKNAKQTPQPTVQLQNQIFSQKTQNSKSCCSQHQQLEKSPQTHISQLKNRSPLSYTQFSLLLLIYENILYMVPSITNKIKEIGQSHKLEFQVPIYLFFKRMCLNQKLIEALLDQQEDGYFTKNSVYDYSDAINHIRKTNTKNIASLVDLSPDTSNLKSTKISNQSSLSVLTGKQSIEQLHKKIKEMKRDFTGLNMKLIKKLLKKISKIHTSNTKHFQFFLNYCSCFLNLSTVNQTIEKLLHSSIKITQPDNNQSSPQKELHEMREFLYKDCGFIEIKYLEIKEKVFEMCFDIQQEHIKIQNYYFELTKKLKSLEQEFKSEK